MKPRATTVKDSRRIVDEMKYLSHCSFKNKDYYTSSIQQYDDSKVLAVIYLHTVLPELMSIGGTVVGQMVSHYSKTARRQGEDI